MRWVTSTCRRDRFCEQRHSLTGLPLASECPPNLQHLCCKFEPILQRSSGPPGGQSWLQDRAQPATPVLQVSGSRFQQGKTRLPYADRTSQARVGRSAAPSYGEVFTRASTSLVGENPPRLARRKTTNLRPATLSVTARPLSGRRESVSTPGAKTGFRPTRNLPVGCGFQRLDVSLCRASCLDCWSRLP